MLSSKLMVALWDSHIIYRYIRPHRLLHLRHWDTTRDVICVIRCQEMETQWHWQGEMSSSPSLSTMCHPHYYFISHTIVSPSSPFGKRDLWPLERIITSHYPPERRIANDPTLAKPKYRPIYHPVENLTLWEKCNGWLASSLWMNTINMHLCWWKQFSNLAICSHETRYLWMLMQRNKTPKLFEARRSVTISLDPITIIINFQLRGKMFWEEERKTNCFYTTKLLSLGWKLVLIFTFYRVVAGKNL